LLPDPNAPGAAWFEAVGRNDVASVRKLLAQGVDVNAPDLRAPLFDGATALTVAAERGLAGMVQLLLSHGANVNARSATGWTALMRACNADQFECARLLLDAGADPTIHNDDGYTAYGRIRANHTELLQLFHDRKADAL
jgi:ankyrin repeat protein